MRSFLLQYAQYNLWANKKITDYLKDYTDGLLSKEVVSSFPSIGKTLMHIWDAQIIWHRRLSGISPKAFPSVEYNKNVMEAFDGLLSSSEDLITWIEEHIQNSEDLDKDIAYTTMSGSPYTQKAGEILTHVFNHGTYHRGQVITMAKQLGFRDLPATDFIFYIRQINA